MIKEIQIFINGQDITVNVDPEMPLVWVIRDVIKLTGTKFGCGVARCGVCTVHINGKASRSCSISIGEVEGKQIKTIEAMGSKDRLHPVQQAWVDEKVPQCGYCQPGQIMSAVALLEQKKGQSLTDQEIDQAMSGNLCRCGTYCRIKKAIRKAEGSI